MASEVFLKYRVSTIFQNCNLSRKVHFERLGYAVSKGQGKKTYPRYGDGNTFLRPILNDLLSKKTYPR